MKTVNRSGFRELPVTSPHVGEQKWHYVPTSFSLGLLQTQFRFRSPTSAPMGYLDLQIGRFWNGSEKARLRSSVSIFEIYWVKKNIERSPRSSNVFFAANISTLNVTPIPVQLALKTISNPIYE